MANGINSFVRVIRIHSQSIECFVSFVVALYAISGWFYFETKDEG